MKGIAVITGVSRGIGCELALRLHGLGYHVFGTTRSPISEGSALARDGITIIDGVDVGSDAGVRPLVSAMGDKKIDVLVNNSGIFCKESLTHMDFDRIEEQFRVNAMGPLRVTYALLNNLKPGSKVMIISSRMGSVGDNGSGSYYGYRMSKAAANMAGKSLAVDLRAQGIIVQLLHPGMVATGMTGGQGIPVAESVDGLVARIESATMENSGKFFHANGEELPW